MSVLGRLLSSIRIAIPVLVGGRCSRRALAAAAKLYGFKLVRRFPFLNGIDNGCPNLHLEDLLILQRARKRKFSALVVGAYDGCTNDPSGDFLAENADISVWVEPQAEPFEKLSAWIPKRPGLVAVRAAIDSSDGIRTLFVVDKREALPKWVDQLASFDRNHIVKHEPALPGVTQAIREVDVNCLSFGTLLERNALDALDLLQLDVEGSDEKLLDWFPFSQMKPAILCYEATHMDAGERERVRQRFVGMGYRFITDASESDEVAFRC